MKIASLFSEKTVFSFEIFPPKKTSSIETIYDTLEALQDLHPDFISVTFGAGGSGNGENTLAIAKRLKEHYGVLPMAHLPCIHYSKAQIDTILEQFRENGIENILALRGDRVEGLEPTTDFDHAADLIRYIRSKDGSFDIAGACYPECHPEAPNMGGNGYGKAVDFQIVPFDFCNGSIVFNNTDMAHGFASSFGMVSRIRSPLGCTFSA